MHKLRKSCGRLLKLSHNIANKTCQFKYDMFAFLNQGGYSPVTHHDNFQKRKKILTCSFIATHFLSLFTSSHQLAYFTHESGVRLDCLRWQHQQAARRVPYKACVTRHLSERSVGAKRGCGWERGTHGPARAFFRRQTSDSNAL